MYLDQEQYLQAVLDRYGITYEKYKAKAIPITGYDQIKLGEITDKLIDTTEYQQKIGSLMYTMIFICPDICFTIGRLSQYISQLFEYHGYSLKGLMRYLKSTIKQRLRYGPRPDCSTRLVQYTDTD